MENLTRVSILSVTLAAIGVAACSGAASQLPADAGGVSGGGGGSGAADAARDQTGTGGRPAGGLGNRKGLAVYWGQNAYGGTHPGDKANFEKPLAQVCAQQPYDIVILAFVMGFPRSRNADGWPEMNFANHCATPYDARNPFLLRCPEIEAGIKSCQAAGKMVLLSLGGAVGNYGFASDAEGTAFAEVVWQIFLGGGGAVRPFGTAVADGVDLDIEGGPAAGYAAFARRLRTLTNGDRTRRYALTAAPQCPFPDAYLGPAPGTAFGDALNSFDYLFVQFYNNYCNLNHPLEFQKAFASWAALSANGGPQIFVGLPSSPAAANAGSFVSATDLPNMVPSVRENPAFGGFMLWDASNDATSAQSGQTYGALAASLLR